jgi:hypothetical protein
MPAIINATVRIFFMRAWALFWCSSIVVIDSFYLLKNISFQLTRKQGINIRSLDIFLEIYWKSTFIEATSLIISVFEIHKNLRPDRLVTIDPMWFMLGQ